MTGQELWASLLQEAISGRLVEQRDDEPEVPQIGDVPEDTPFAAPKKWKWVRIKDIISMHMGGGTPSKQYPEYWGGSIPWASVKDMQGDVLTKTVDSITKRGLQNSASNLIPSGNIIICTRIGLGKIVFNAIDVAINQDLRALFLNYSIIDRSYFFYFYHTLNIIGNGLTVKGVRISNLLETLLPLPPLAEQRRIVARLEELRPLVDDYGTAEAELSKLEADLPDRLRASLLQEAISGRLVEQRDDEPAVEQIGDAPEDVPFAIPAKWKWYFLGLLSHKIHYGYTASAEKTGLIHLLRITDIQNGHVNWSSVPYCGIKKSDAEKFLLNKNDIVIARTGGTIGKSFMIQDENVNSVFASYLIRIILKSKLFPKYIPLFFDSPLYWAQIQSASQGTGQPNVNAKALSHLLIPLPPLAEQRRIVARLEELLPEVAQLTNKGETKH